MAELLEVGLTGVRVEPLLVQQVSAHFLPLAEMGLTIVQALSFHFLRLEAGLMAKQALSLHFLQLEAGVMVEEVLSD